MYPNSTVTVTQDYRFNLLQFARENSDQVLIRPLDDLEMIKRVVYLPALRRRDGDGFVAESLVFGGYTVAWGEHEMTAIVASVSLHSFLISMICTFILSIWETKADGDSGKKGSSTKPNGISLGRVPPSPSN